MNFTSKFPCVETTFMIAKTFCSKWRFCKELPIYSAQYLSVDGFRLIDETMIETSKSKWDYMKIKHQQGAQLSFSKQGNVFILPKNNNCHQLGNACL